MYSLDENNYLFDIRKLLKTILMTLNKVCYISLNKTAESVIEFCKENGIDTQKLIIIDMISPRLGNTKARKNVSYIKIDDSKKVVGSVIDVLKKEKCDALIIDSLSTLHIYFEEKEMMKIVHDVLVYSGSKHIITNLIVQKKDSEADYVKSLIPLVGNFKEVNFD